MAKDWIKLNIGLLYDERFVEMSHETRSVWTIAYLIVAREGGAVRDDERLVYLFERQGVPDAETAVVALRSAGWLVPHTKGGVTIRGYERYQPVWRGPSDDPEEKKLRNANRDTTREGRRRGASGASVERQRRGERVDTPAQAREKPDTRTLKEIVGDFEEIIKPPKA